VLTATVCYLLTNKLTYFRPVSIRTKIKAEGGKGFENGHTVGEIDEAILRKGEVHYSTYYQQHGELPTNAQGFAQFH
jgi:pre-mRNA-processing factor 39